MAKSTPVMLTATGIAVGNEWMNGHGLKFKMVMAGLAASLILDGIEKISEPGAIGLATIVLVSVLLTNPADGGTSPFQTLEGWTGTSTKPVTPQKGKIHHGK